MDNQIINNEEYFGEYIREWKPEHKNMYVTTGMIQGKEPSSENRVGRVVQVRLEQGDYGSDCVLIRHRNELLVPHENQSFWLVPDKFKEYLDECFKDVCEDDSDEYEYTIQGHNGEKGFIVPSPIKEGESTPMRDIKNKIRELL